MINQLAISGACCCLQFCCKEIFQTAYKLIGRVAFIKFMYCLIYFAFILSVYLAMYLLREWQFFMRIFADGINCLALTEEFDCISASVIYRITLSLFIFSVIMASILLVSTVRVAKILNEGLFFSKFVLTLIIFLVTLQLDNAFITYFSNFSQIFSYVFIIWQVIIVIDLAYLWGIKWAAHFSEGKSCYGYLLIGVTILNYSIAICLNAYGYVLSNTSDSSQGKCNNYQNILSTALLLVMFGVQLLYFNKQNSLLTTSVLSIFTSYWLLSAIFSQQECNNSIVLGQYDVIIGKSQFLKINIPISLIFVIISSFGSIFGSSNQEKNDNFIELQQNINLDKALKLQQEQSLYEQKRLWIKWHLFMMAMSLYIGMVCTDWGSGDIINGKFKLTANSQISKVFTSCSTFLIYVWTLIAPRILTGRNFYFQ